MFSTRSIRKKNGFYTLEAVIVLPLVILAVISIGYFIRLDAVWENVMHCAIDESAYSASRAYDSVSELDSIPKVRKRILRENDLLLSLKIRGVADRYSDGVSDELTCYTIKAAMGMDLPAGFSRRLDFTGRIKYRGFRGFQYPAAGMGDEGLERDEPKDPVWIFPQSGERYHTSSCTYVRATVKADVLTNSLKNRSKPCDMCNSGEFQTKFC